jgi:hypothetical protein
LDVTSTSGAYFWISDLKIQETTGLGER